MKRGGDSKGIAKAHWQQRRLGDCLTLMSGGTPSKARNDYWGGDIPWVSCKDMKVHRIHDAEDHLTPLGAKNGTRLVPANTILFVVRGMILAREFPVALTKRTVAFNQDLKAARPADFIETEFLFHWLRANTYEILGRVDEAGHGTTRIQTDRLLSLPIAVPPLLVQRRIAGILSAYDELIENSQRRIKILEAMVRALYREWFVYFRFPGHESVPRVPSPLGEIPQGWEVRAVAQAFDISGGGTPSRKEEAFWVGGTIQWYSPSDLTGAGTMFMDDSSDHITERGLAQSSARMFPARSVMLTSRATIGALAINTHPACTNQGFITCLPNERVPLYFLFHWLTENVPTFQRMASGATFKEISRGVFKTINFLQPPDELVRRFEVMTAPIAEQMLALQRQIKNLRRTRDLLLPRLLSGRIAIQEN